MFPKHPLSNKEFLKEYGLTLLIENDKVESVEKLLSKANESYVVTYTKVVEGDHTEFTIVVPTTNFANAYYYMGFIFSKIWTPK